MVFAQLRLFFESFLQYMLVFPEQVLVFQLGATGYTVRTPAHLEFRAVRIGAQTLAAYYSAGHSFQTACFWRVAL